MVRSSVSIVRRASLIAALVALPFATCGSGCETCTTYVEVAKSASGDACTANAGEANLAPSECVASGCTASHEPYALDGCFYVGNNVACQLVCRYAPQSGSDTFPITDSARCNYPSACPKCVDLGGELGCELQLCEGG